MAIGRFLRILRDFLHARRQIGEFDKSGETCQNGISGQNREFMDREH
jgi:hypothetical protein